MLKLFKDSPQDLKIMRGPFKGARVFLNPANSKRKLLGLYESCLNSWITEVAPQKEFAFDVGSNTGYDLYGLAHLISNQNEKSVHVIGFEPDADDFPELLGPIDWPEYSRCHVEIIKKFAGAEPSDDSTTLDTCFAERDFLAGKKGLIKIDVEGAEVDVLQGATSLLENSDHDWLIEIHGKELIPSVSDFFVSRKRPFLIKSLEPIPIIGPESREIETFWLVTI